MNFLVQNIRERKIEGKKDGVERRTQKRKSPEKPGMQLNQQGAHVSKQGWKNVQIYFHWFFLRDLREGEEEEEEAAAALTFQSSSITITGTE